MQPSLFDQPPETIEAEKLILLALGEFQERGKVLINRELPLDRLRGAFRRAAETLQTIEPNDEILIAELERMGAKIVRVPSYVAKHPFRVTINETLALIAAEFAKSFKPETRA